jgi:hypothetical protein
MNKQFRNLIFLTLGIYSIVLLAVEANTSQDYVRQYFTDITGDVRFYAVNTTLSSFLLFATSLIFAICLTFIRREPNNQREYTFYISQIAVFFYLGFDDRFQIHDDLFLMEFLGHKVTHSFLLAVGMAEIYFLWFYGRLLEQKWDVQRPLLIGVILFGLMFLVDVFEPPKMPLRLSIEDLLKTWANVFFFLFAWAIFTQKLVILKKRVNPEPAVEENHLVAD